ncbi:MAG TPA: FecR domain-containing protein [Methylomirabilota bacterium]|nr:FecR domain-containing protein [Methylomirabilota bacterium]
MARTVSRARTAALACSTWLLLPSAALAQGVPVGTAQNAVGTLVVVRTDGIEHRLQGRGSVPLFEGDVLRTEPGSQAMVQLRPSMPVALNEKTSLKILSRWDKSAGTIRILRVSQGEVWAKAGSGAAALEIETPAAVAAARDAEVDLKVAEDGQSALTVVSGSAEFGTPFGVCAVRAGAASVGARGAACTAPQPANAAAAVGWKQTVSQ